MTGTDIKAAVYNLTKDRTWASTTNEVDQLIKDWMMMVVEEFPPEAIESNTAPLVDVVAGDRYELPVDFSAVDCYEVYDNDDNLVRYEPDDLIFTADNQVIYPIDIVLGRLVYHPIPVFEDVTDDIPLQKIFHSCIVYFFYGQYYYQSGEGDYEEHKMADTYMARFERMKAQKMNTFMNKTSDNTPIKTKDVLPRSNGRGSAVETYYE